MESHQTTTVLVVEDEGLVRLDAAESLRDAGFEVVEASDGREALEAMERRDDIGVVFTDIDMPGGIDGLELARRVRRVHPRTRLILTSGSVRPDPRQMPADGAFLSKPYSTDVVASTIRRMLA
ncbi:MAG: response regulator [Caulobacteraceae bacterium]|nr:response regulator [Caulobacteraceae bacterium]